METYVLRDVQWFVDDSTQNVHLLDDTVLTEQCTESLVLVIATLFGSVDSFGGLHSTQRSADDRQQQYIDRVRLIDSHKCFVHSYGSQQTS